MKKERLCLHCKMPIGKELNVSDPRTHFTFINCIESLQAALSSSRLAALEEAAKEVEWLAANTDEMQPRVMLYHAVKCIRNLAESPENQPIRTPEIEERKEA